MAEIKSLLDNVIEKEISYLESLPDGENATRAINDLVQLHKLRIDEIKTQAEIEDREKRTTADIDRIYTELVLKDREYDSHDNDRVRDEEIAAQQAKENRIDRYVRTGVAVLEVILPLAFYGIWMRQGFEFEKTGSFTSTTFKNLMNRFRPTK